MNKAKSPRRALVAALPAAAAVLTAAACTNAGMGSEAPTTPTPGASSSAQAGAPAAPSAGGGAAPGAGTCKPSGTSLQISAMNVKFDKSCLAAPAGKAFTLMFKNGDAGVPHDVAIFTNSSATTTLFKGSIVTGPSTTTYHVPALKAGSYYFRCDIHPTQMFGTFVVG